MIYLNKSTEKKVDIYESVNTFKPHYLELHYKDQDKNLRYLRIQNTVKQAYNEVPGTGNFTSL